MPMMPVMLIDPPASTPAHQKIADHKATDLHCPRIADNLSMTKVMTKVTDLGEDKTQKNCIQKLEPEVVYYEQKCQAHDQQAQGEENFIGVVERLLIQQAFLLHDLFQLGVLICKDARSFLVPHMLHLDANLFLHFSP